MIQYSSDFDDLNDISKKSIPFIIYPKVISDNRGSFSEVMKNDKYNTHEIAFMKDCSWIK
jgi:dTDP-4-dehydrorhamnose 3,5-epimerase-like enzyme